MLKSCLFGIRLLVNHLALAYLCTLRYLCCVSGAQGCSCKRLSTSTDTFIRKRRHSGVFHVKRVPYEGSISTLTVQRWGIIGLLKSKALVDQRPVCLCSFRCHGVRLVVELDLLRFSSVSVISRGVDGP